MQDGKTTPVGLGLHPGCGGVSTRKILVNSSMFSRSLVGSGPGCRALVRPSPQTVCMQNERRRGLKTNATQSAGNGSRAMARRATADGRGSFGAGRQRSAPFGALAAESQVPAKSRSRPLSATSVLRCALFPATQTGNPIPASQKNRLGRTASRNVFCSLRCILVRFRVSKRC